MNRRSLLSSFPSTTVALSIAGALCALFAPATTWAVDKIVWLMPELDTVAPPSPGAASVPVRRGLAQPLSDYLTANWGTPAKHEVLIANVKRSWRMVEDGEQACHLGVLRTPEREAVAYFFDTHLIPPHQLMVRRDALAKLPRHTDGDADLEKIWAEKQLRGAIVAGRSYGRALDALLARRPPGAIEEYTTSDFGGNMLSMIAIGRADYTIEFDFVLANQQELRATVAAGSAGGASGNAKVSTADLVSVPIEGFSSPVISGIACPRNAWGKRTIEQVERVLSTPQARQFMRDEFISHLSPEAQARYGSRIDAFYFYAKPAGGAPK
ncbi:hypothetical protein [Mitsuaria sp. 7]|uniref:hypothetical protein n=1 Tax=Mitsuaria sp. 7 TaxID=1658665 RepID=UPI0007DD243B|nr:hypothetical protein [Mitsuaria sp. 7]ANH69724.1 hypothetical protein ABE85_22925 [Mitsuaria sp. 7]